MGRDREKEVIVELAPCISGVEGSRRKGMGVHVRRERK